MKKQILLFVAGAALLAGAGACSREGADALVPTEWSETASAPSLAPAAREIIISAYSGDSGASTKSSRDEDGTFYWSPADSISVFLGNGSDGGSLFVSSNSERAQKTDFIGTVEDSDSTGVATYWAIYPYNKVNACDSTALTTLVPSAQTAAAGTFADKMFVSIGRSTSLSMGFYHLCGGIKFTLSQEGITRISLSGNAGETLAGTVEVTVDENNHPTVQKVKSAEKEVVLTPPVGQLTFAPGVTYYFVTLPVTFSKGFTFAFEKENGEYGIRTVTSNMTVNRAKFRYSNNAIDANVSFQPKGSFESPEYQDIENAQARKYLDTVDYSSDLIEYKNSYFDTNSPGSGNDKPNPVSFSWTGAASSLEYSTSEDMSTDLQVVSVSTSPSAVYNLIPGVSYYYRVVSKNGFILKEGCIVPVGPLRIIKASKAGNFRDLGGWKGEGGKTIAYGKLYRGTQTSSTDRALFQSLNIAMDLDLRGNGGGSAQRVFSDLDYRNIQVYQFMYKSGEEPGYTQELYQEALHCVIDTLLKGKVIYFHCIGGADRTGTLAFLIEALLGVSENDLSKDYELTSFYSTRKRNDNSERPFKQLVFYMKTFAESEESTINECVYNWATTQVPGSAQEPLSPDDIALLKEIMLVDSN